MVKPPQAPYKLIYVPLNCGTVPNSSGKYVTPHNQPTNQPTNQRGFWLIHPGNIVLSGKVGGAGLVYI